MQQKLTALSQRKMVALRSHPHRGSRSSLRSEVGTRQAGLVFYPLITEFSK
jgi:hypothetical protein